MPVQLLPASAQAFAPRTDPEIVLNSKAELWLTQTLKRINKVKRPLNSVVQHRKCLIETLGGANAIWTLASLMLPKASEAELRQDASALADGMFNFQLLHVEAYVVHVDMVSQHEVAFKLTPETIKALIAYHKDIYAVDAAASTWAWPEKNAQVKKMQEEFVQAANRFVFRTDVRALEGLEEEGAGELLDGRSAQVKAAVMNLFLPLLPPPPRIVDVIHPAPILPNIDLASSWWPSPPPTLPSSQPLPADAWNMLPSTPSPTITTCSEVPGLYWPDLGINAVQLPSPSPSLSPPTFNDAPGMYASPECGVVLPASMYLPQHCGVDFGLADLNALGLTSAWAPLYLATA